MAVTEKQLTANLQNAKLGGVKTEAGKEITKLNAMKHGLLSKQTLLTNENKKELSELCERLKDCLQPETEMELIFVEKIIADTWRLRRALKVEAEMIEEDLEYETYTGEKVTRTTGQVFSNDLSQRDSFGKLIRYIASIERGIYRALHELQRLQAGRKGQEVLLPAILDVDVNQEE